MIENKFKLTKQENYIFPRIISNDDSDNSLESIKYATMYNLNN